MFKKGFLNAPSSRSSSLESAAKPIDTKPDNPKHLVTNRKCVAANGIYHIHSSYADGYEELEQYDEHTHLPLCKKHHKAGFLLDPCTVPAESKNWVFDVGYNAPYTGNGNDSFGTDASSSCGIKESASSPFIVRRDSKYFFEWRIRNLFCQSDNYAVEVNDAKGGFVIRTKDCKYYAEIPLPTVRRKRIPLDRSQFQWQFENRAILIAYKKPQQVLDYDKEIIEFAKKHALRT